MDSSKINDWMQVVGIFAVVASLIFVGLQMRQTQEIALSAAYQARAETAIELVTSMADNEKMLVAMYQPQNQEELALLTPQERWVADIYAQAVLLLYENVHFQYEKGFISEDDWLRIHTNLRLGMSSPAVRRGLMNRVDRMRPSFREVVVEINEELPE